MSKENYLHCPFCWRIIPVFLNLQNTKSWEFVPNSRECIQTLDKRSSHTLTHNRRFWMFHGWFCLRLVQKKKKTKKQSCQTKFFFKLSYCLQTHFVTFPYQWKKFRLLSWLRNFGRCLKYLCFAVWKAILMLMFVLSLYEQVWKLFFLLNTIRWNSC